MTKIQNKGYVYEQEIIRRKMNKKHVKRFLLSILKKNIKLRYNF